MWGALGLNEVQLPKELQRRGGLTLWKPLRSLNEVQLPKELQLSACVPTRPRRTSLNEVQLPKELQRVGRSRE